MKEYEIGILEDEQHKFYDADGREIIFWMVGKIPFEVMPLKLRIQDVLWDSKKEARVLLVDDSNIYTKHWMDLGLSYEDAEQLPPMYANVFGRIVKSGRSIALEIFASEGALNETERTDGYVEEETHYFEIGIDETFNELAVYNGVMHVDYLENSFLYDGDGKGHNVLLLVYEPTDGEYYSYVLNARGFVMDFDPDFEDAEWAERCKAVRNMYGVDLEEVNWAVKGKPEVCDNGEKIRMTLANRREAGELELDVEMDTAAYLAGKKWKIVDMRTVFLA